VFHYFAEKTSSGFHYSGFEKIDPKQPYLFIGNHRDIILDSAFLQIYHFKNGHGATLSAIGDNLLSSKLFTEIAHMHKMFLVQRSGTLKEKIYNTYLLSSYIHHALFVEKNSVWISQGNGRTKNGDDKTQQGLLKMLLLDDPQPSLQILQQYQITPVAISYQYEPCAQLKARELALSEKTTYTKKPGEDAKSIFTGISGYKGEVHFVIGKPLQQEFETIPSHISINEKLAMLCNLIDRQIYDNYFLFPQNYIALDLIEDTDTFHSHYTQDEKLDFMNYLDKQATVAEVSKDKMMKYLLDIYANPVRNKLRFEI
jgi:hypothetical protein